MSVNCTSCGHTNVIKKGSVLRQSVKHDRFKCKNCGNNFYLTATQQTVDPVDVFIDNNFVRDEDWVLNKKLSTRFVITSAQSNAPVNLKFLQSLKTYCKHNDAELLVIQTRYKTSNLLEDDLVNEYPKEIEEFTFENNIRLNKNLKVLGLLKVAATADNPLSGLAPISKGDSVIIGHNQLQMMTLPVQPNEHPIIMTTTGTISEKKYSESKQGYKAEFNHSQSAVIVELDGDSFHLRHLNFDGVGFYDFEKYYSSTGIKTPLRAIEAIVTGDEHAIFFDKEVKEATYGKDGIVDSLNPKYIVRHDVLDCYSISHHHRNNTMTKFKKFVTGENNMKAELDETIKFIVETTPKNSINIIVPSNHTDHLTKWLNECEIKYEPWNSIVYHYLMYNMLQSINLNPSNTPDPFELYSAEDFEKYNTSVEFLGRRDSYKILDIEVAIHGDKGMNGSRGSRAQFAMLPSKTIVGHSHSPGIEKGCYQTGTSSTLQLEYNDGPSTWMNTHALIYANGKRQLVNIINGKWRA